ncbi:DoxX family protein [Photorhabdus tasmaniensis]|uniref:DoxX family protein n=1 Tax=Photorhabdus tasmaniensis TaxID=1004159 RepID=A0ABX0GFA5_9GAMM|nr:DoxX family protein [Photorhabdus tasmaniensis]NHB87464.1 DoxX family protein [Photorhabdus tasmaniensis]
MLKQFDQFVNYPDFAKLFLRLSLGCLMLLHGIHKVQPDGLKGIEAMLTNVEVPTFIAYGVLIGEIVCPVLIILGIFTRVAALIVALTMGVAVVLIHGSDIFFLNNATGGWGVESAGLFFLVALSIMFQGSGRFTLIKD